MAKITKAELKRQAEQEAERVALLKTVNRDPVPLRPIDWSTSNASKNPPCKVAKYIRGGVTDFLKDGETPLARSTSSLLYDIKGGELGVYTERAIVQICQAGTFDEEKSNTTKEHPYGREKAGEVITDWWRNNMDAPLEQFFEVLEPYVRTTIASKSENMELIKYQNAGELGVHDDWPTTYQRAGIKWFYIHFPEGKRVRSVSYLRKAAVALGIEWQPKGDCNDDR